MPRTQTQTEATGVLKSISNKEAYQLFRLIAASPLSSDALKTQSGLTRKQYYSRLSRMVKAGLVKKRSGKYSLTALGKIVQSSLVTIEYASNNLWKLKAVDTITTSSELPAEEQIKLIGTIIDDVEVKEILSK